MSNVLSCYRGTSEQTITAIFDVAEILAPSMKDLSGASLKELAGVLSG